MPAYSTPPPPDDPPAWDVDSDVGRLVISRLPLDTPARAVSRAYKRSADVASVERVAALIGSTFDSRDPAAAAARMCRDAAAWRSGALTAAARELGATRADRFLRAIATCCRAGATVAGSAALYLERVLQDPAPADADADAVGLGWWPNDIDAWVDSPPQGAHVLGALIPLGSPVEAMHRSEDGYAPFKGYWPGRETIALGIPGEWDGYHGGRAGHVPAVYPGSAMVCTVKVDDQQRVQVISQNSVERGGYERTAPECACSSDPRSASACAGCLKQHRAPPAKTGPLDVRPLAGQLRARCYFDAWPAGRPEARFDLDTVCVTIRADDRGFLQIERYAGDARGATMRVRPHAMWRFAGAGDALIRADADAIAALGRRLRKYRARGWTDARVPAETVVDGRVVATPPDLIQAIERQLAGEVFTF